MPGLVTNLHVSVREWGDEVVFLHRILPGRTDQSYGIHVAKLAGLPSPVIQRAQQLLDSLSVSHDALEAAEAATPDAPPSAGNEPAQLGLFREYIAHPVVDELRELKIESLSPLEAFDALRALQERAAQDPSA